MTAKPKFAGWHRGTGDETHSSTNDVLEMLVPGEGTATSSRQVHMAQAGDADTDWGLAAQTNPLFVVHSTTTPITCYLSLSHDATNGVITTSGATNAGLSLTTGGTGQILFRLGGTDTLNIHDVTGVTFAAATDVAGHPLFEQTEDGGVASAGTAGAGGAWNVQTGDGGIGAADCNRAGGAGGAYTIVSGTGGAIVACDTAAAGAGGAVSVTAGAGGSIPVCATGAPGLGGAMTFTAGVGSATAVPCDVSGIGGAMTIAAGAGGAVTAASGASNDAGIGGALVLAAGAGGASTSANGGDGADVCISVGAGGTGTGGAAGGAAGDIFFRSGTAVEGGAIGNFFFRNATTGIGMVVAAEGSAPTTGVGSIWGLDGALTACNQAPANNAILMIIIS